MLRSFMKQYSTMAEQQHRGPAVPTRRSASCYRAALVLSIIFVLLCKAHASASRKWSGYTLGAVNHRCAEAALSARVPIGMWGCAGEKWDSRGPLTDFAFAGYGAGLEDIPDLPVTVDIKRDFQAVGDGKKDDTTAVLAALKATEEKGGVIYFPPGKYLLTNQLNMSSNQVLRGAGKDLTNLFFNTSLQQLYGWGPNWKAGMEKSPYTWAGALISTQRDKRIFNPNSLKLGDIARAAARGDTRVYVGNLRDKIMRAEELIIPGQWVAITMAETEDADLARSLCNNRTDVGARLGPDFGNRQMFIHMTRVTAVGPDWVEIERPLYADIGLEFKPSVLRSYNFKVTGVGVEDLQIEFPWTPYLGHHEEPGYNAIEYEAAVNSWIRRVRILNADSGIKMYSSIFNTVSDVEVGVTPKPRRGGRWFGRDKVIQQADKDGHMAIALHWASFDNLVEKFNITALYYHELLVAGYSAHNVFHNGTGADVCLDHHGGAPHSNLWTDIDLGSGQAAMRWSGAPEHYPFAGSNNVFWNIWASKIPVKYDYVSAGMLSARAGSSSSRRIDMHQSRRMAKLPVLSRPAKIQGYGQVVVDMPLSNQIPPIKEAADWFIWYKPSEQVWPPNLFNAMRSSAARRLKVAPETQTLASLTGQRLPQQTSNPVPVFQRAPSSSHTNNTGSRSSAGPQAQNRPATNNTRRDHMIALQQPQPDQKSAAAAAAAPGRPTASIPIVHRIATLPHVQLTAQSPTQGPAANPSVAAAGSQPTSTATATSSTSTAAAPLKQQRPAAVAPTTVVVPPTTTAAADNSSAVSNAAAVQQLKPVGASLAAAPAATGSAAASTAAVNHTTHGTVGAQGQQQQQQPANATSSVVSTATQAVSGAGHSGSPMPQQPSRMVGATANNQQQPVTQVKTAPALASQGPSNQVFAAAKLRPPVMTSDTSSRNNKEMTEVTAGHTKQQTAAVDSKDQPAHVQQQEAVPPTASPIVHATPAHGTAVVAQLATKQQQQQQVPTKPAASL